jgi:hypothetical protein
MPSPLMPSPLMPHNVPPNVHRLSVSICAHLGGNFAILLTGYDNTRAARLLSGALARGKQ